MHLKLHLYSTNRNNTHKSNNPKEKKKCHFTKARTSFWNLYHYHLQKYFLFFFLRKEKKKDLEMERKTSVRANAHLSSTESSEILCSFGHHILVKLHHYSSFKLSSYAYVQKASWIHHLQLSGGYSIVKEKCQSLSKSRFLFWTPLPHVSTPKPPGHHHHFHSPFLYIFNPRAVTSCAKIRPSYPALSLCYLWVVSGGCYTVRLRCWWTGGLITVYQIW